MLGRLDGGEEGQPTTLGLSNCFVSGWQECVSAFPERSPDRSRLPLLSFLCSGWRLHGLLSTRIIVRIVVPRNSHSVRTEAMGG